MDHMRATFTSSGVQFLVCLTLMSNTLDLSWLTTQLTGSQIAKFKTGTTDIGSYLARILTDGNVSFYKVYVSREMTSGESGRRFI